MASHRLGRSLIISCMNAATFELVERKLIANTTKPLSVILAFDGDVAHNKARQFFAHLLEEFEEELDLESGCWSFAQLCQERFAEEAARAAATADLIGFVSAAPGDLPFPVKAWIERWLAKKEDRDAALVALVGRESGGAQTPSPMQQYLEHIAKEAGLSFFPGTFALPEAAPRFAPETIRARAETRTALIETILNYVPPPPRWGINE
jgi:hypothetical protein